MGTSFQSIVETRIYRTKKDDIQGLKMNPSPNTPEWSSIPWNDARSEFPVREFRFIGSKDLADGRHYVFQNHGSQDVVVVVKSI